MLPVAEVFLADYGEVVPASTEVRCGDYRSQMCIMSGYDPNMTGDYHKAEMEKAFCNPNGNSERHSVSSGGILLIMSI